MSFCILGCELVTVVFDAVVSERFELFFFHNLNMQALIYSTLIVQLVSML